MGKQDGINPYGFKIVEGSGALEVITNVESATNTVRMNR